MKAILLSLALVLACAGCGKQEEAPVKPPAGNTGAMETKADEMKKEAEEKAAEMKTEADKKAEEAKKAAESVTEDK